jgi:hypothetical protein
MARRAADIDISPAWWSGQSRIATVEVGPSPVTAT